MGPVSLICTGERRVNGRGTDVPSVDQMLHGETTGRQALMDPRESIDVLLRRGSRDNLDDHVRAGAVTRLRLVIAVADPRSGPR